jgi:hypothetical protein
MPADTRSADAAMDAASLYREEIVTDRKVGRSDDGADQEQDLDPRDRLFRRSADQTNMGALPVSFDIRRRISPNRTSTGSRQGRHGRTMRELQELRRQASSGLIVPPAAASA